RLPPVHPPRATPWPSLGVKISSANPACERRPSERLECQTVARRGSDLEQVTRGRRCLGGAEETRDPWSSSCRRGIARSRETARCLSGGVRAERVRLPTRRLQIPSQKASVRPRARDLQAHRPV